MWKESYQKTQEKSGILKIKIKDMRDNEEKILIFILLSFLGFIANVYLSEILNTVLLGNEINIKNLKFFYSLKDLFINEDKRKLFLLLECIKYLVIAFFITQNNKPYQAELVKITDNIYTPKSVTISVQFIKVAN